MLSASAASSAMMRMAARSSRPGIWRRHHQAIARRTVSTRAADNDSSMAVHTAALLGAGLVVLAGSFSHVGYRGPTHMEEAVKHDEDETTTLLNWSGTHKVHVLNSRYWEPETLEELESIVKRCHKTKTPLRPLGSALSPNGIGFHPGGMVSLTNLDKVLKVDKDNMTVTVQAGARVSQVRKHARKVNRSCLSTCRD